MAFKRALWHSGLTYHQTCRQCHTLISYTDHQLDFRPWYADGFVYCPKCRTPLRHNEAYAIDASAPKTEPVPAAAPDVSAPSTDLPAFCTACGKKFREDDRFCSGCGAKRV